MVEGLIEAGVESVADRSKEQTPEHYFAPIDKQLECPQPIEGKDNMDSEMERGNKSNLEVSPHYYQPIEAQLEQREAVDNHAQVQEGPVPEYSRDASEGIEPKRDGLIDEQKIEIQEKTEWSDRIVDSIRTMDEAQVYMDAGLQEGEVNGNPALLQPKIDGKAYNEPKWPDWSNKDLAEEGYPPRDETGRPYELHHIGQNPDSPLAELTYEQHHCNGNFKKLHTFDESSIDRQQFNQERKEYWKDRFQTL